MFNKKVIRVVAIVMAALMLLGVFGAAISAFALESTITVYENPATGQPSSFVPIIIGVVAFIAAIVCVVLSKKSGKNTEDNVESDYIEEESVEENLKFFTSKKADNFVEKPDNTEED